MTRSLVVWLHESIAGRLTQGDDGLLEFTYSQDFLSTGAAAAISVSMPPREIPYTDRVVRPFFSGLLPDEQARRRLASALGVSEGNAFGLLEIIGGDCAGALTLLPDNASLPEPSVYAPEPLTEKQLVRILDLLHSRPLLGGEMGVRISLAGAQDKIAVCVVDDRVALARDGRPTTHILKPAIDGLAGTVENEAFCMRLARLLGLSAPRVVKGTAGKIDYLLVERYDRCIDGSGRVTRLHQEDGCQALSVPPELKYEDEGGPGIAAIEALIARHTRRPAADRLAFLRNVIFHYLVGNADAHAKNIALLYRDIVPDLAPLYDVVCTAAYPGLSKRMAMKVGGRALPDTIQLKHWLSLVPDTGVARRLLRKELREMAAGIVVHSAELLAQMKEEGDDHPVLKTVSDVIGKRAKHVQSIVQA